MKIDKEIKKMLVFQFKLLLIGILVILLIETGIIQRLLPVCTAKKVFGVICPTCGVTRCVANIIKFDFRTAFMYHPLFFIATFYLIFIDIVYVLQVLSKKEWLKKLYPNWLVGIIFLVTFIIQYIYRIIIIISGNGFEFL